MTPTAYLLALSMRVIHLLGAIARREPHHVIIECVAYGRDTAVAIRSGFDTAPKKTDPRIASAFSGAMGTVLALIALSLYLPLALH
jgi:hypothetical protein